MEADELRGARRDKHHEDACRDDRGARLDRRVAEHVLQELLAEVGSAHERAEDDDPGAGGDPERRAGGHVEVVERVPRATLPDDEEEGRDGCGPQQREREGLLVRYRQEVDRDDQPADEHSRERAPHVVDRIRCLLDVARHEADRHRQRDDHERQRHEEHPLPADVLEQRTRDERAEEGNAAAERRPERDRLRTRGPRPQRRDQREGGRVGHACREPADETRTEQHSRRRSEARGERRRDAQTHPEDDHQLAPVPVAERPEPEDGRCEPQRVADRNQVEHRL